MFKALLACIVACSFTGCAYLRSTTMDPVVTVHTNGVVTVAYKKTSVRAFTAFDSNSALAKFRNTTGGPSGTNGWAPGTWIGSLDQSSTTSNAVPIIEAVASGAVQGAVKSMKPQ